MDIDFIEQLVVSTEEAILKLETLIKKKKKEEATKMKAFILDLHRQITDSLKEDYV